MEIQGRIQQLIEELGLTRAAFAHSIDMQPSAISHVLNGRNRPSLEMLDHIKASYPETDLNWLISGAEDQKSIKNFNKPMDKPDIQSVINYGESVKEKSSDVAPPLLDLTNPDLEQVLLMYSNGSCKVYKVK
jgi:transcriptional regulator with XRE-family HTH domain